MSRPDMKSLASSDTRDHAGRPKLIKPWSVCWMVTWGEGWSKGSVPVRRPWARHPRLHKSQLNLYGTFVSTSGATYPRVPYGSNVPS